MRIGKSVWLARRKNETNAETLSYDNPIEIVTRPNCFTVMPASSGNYMEVIKSGENLYNTWLATANDKYNFNIKVGDLMWLDGEKPIAEIENEYGVGSSATAEVKSVSYGNVSTVIRLERNQRQVK